MFLILYGLFCDCLEAEEDDTPKPDFKPPPVAPREDGTATNKKTYFVCNDRKCQTIACTYASVIL